MTNKFLSIQEKSYPQLLKEIYRPPEKLFYQGDLNHLNKTCVSIVGTRKCTSYGEEMTKLIVDDLSILDVVIVSGMALGIDTIAHQTALETGLPTIAVLGSGLGKIYPPQNRELAKKITENGLLISEFAENEDPKKINFPQRNRIISGLSIATIVIEANEISGALITAKFALEQNREIFAVPSDVCRPTSMGILRLLQRGAAYPVANGREIVQILNETKKLPLKEFQVPIKKPFKSPEFKINNDEKKVLSCIPKHSALSIEQLQKKSNFSISTLLVHLSSLEILGILDLKAGKYKRVL